MTGKLLVDTGPIVAILMESDQHHEASVEQLRSIRGPLLTCWPVITEAAWLLREFPEAIRSLLASFESSVFELLPLADGDLPAISAILTRYAGLRIQLADAALLHLANRARIDSIFTLDRRDFGVMTLAHGKKLRMIP